MSVAEIVDAYMAAWNETAQKQGERTGARLVLRSAVDTHHGRFRFHWRLVDADGGRGPKSLDFGQVAPDGRIASMVGFFGPPPGDRG